MQADFKNHIIDYINLLEAENTRIDNATRRIGRSDRLIKEMHIKKQIYSRVISDLNGIVEKIKRSCSEAQKNHFTEI